MLAVCGGALAVGVYAKLATFYRAYLDELLCRVIFGVVVHDRDVHCVVFLLVALRRLLVEEFLKVRIDTCQGEVLKIGPWLAAAIPRFNAIGLAAEIKFENSFLTA